MLSWAGLRATAPDMKKSADSYFDQQNLMDLRIVSTLGLTEEDAARPGRPAGGGGGGAGLYSGCHCPSDRKRLCCKGFILYRFFRTQRPQSGGGPPAAGGGRMSGRALLLVETGLELGDQITLDTGSGSFEALSALRPTPL